MSEHNDGGPAFPWAGGRGMTLRDYFAAKASDADIAAQVEIAWPPIPNGRFPIAAQRPINWRAIARYMYADAMLAARGETDGR